MRAFRWPSAKNLTLSMKATAFVCAWCAAMAPAVLGTPVEATLAEGWEECGSLPAARSAGRWPDALTAARSSGYLQAARYNRTGSNLQPRKKDVLVGRRASGEVSMAHAEQAIETARGWHARGFESILWDSAGPC